MPFWLFFLRMECSVRGDTTLSNKIASVEKKFDSLKKIEKETGKKFDQQLDEHMGDRILN